MRRCEGKRVRNLDPDRTIEKIIEALDGKGFSPEAGEPESRRKELNAIARMMREEPAPEPATDFGERVMFRIRAFRPSPWKVLGEALLKPHNVSFHPLNALRSPVSGQECSFYFIMVGVFYAILGVNLDDRPAQAGCVPGCSGLGPLAAADRPRHGRLHGGHRPLSPEGRKLALCMARMGALVYLGFALLNGIFVPLEWDLPVSAALSLLSMLVGVPTGFS